MIFGPASSKIHETPYRFHGISETMFGFATQLITVSAHAVGLATHATPAIEGRDLTEVYLTQPAIMAHASFGSISFDGMLNFEGLTLERGELNAGVWGEGYVDRRHPHTYLHEAMLTYEATVLGGRASVSAGRGFAPFGTDDPMVRHFVKYPSNHHLSQILERLVFIGAARRGPVTLEASLFAGAEPVNPRDNGSLDKFGDSWSARLTVRPRSWLELQSSYAAVHSPENEFGVGLDHEQWNFSARGEGNVRGFKTYALIEAGELSESDEEFRLFFFNTVLAEVAATKNKWQIAARFEQSERPEEERELDNFRTVRPSAHYSILGITRWTIGTLQISRQSNLGPVSVRPFAEISNQRAKPLEEPAILDPDNLYGGRNLWSFSLGIRSTIGSWHERMGRYGAARVANTHHTH